VVDANINAYCTLDKGAKKPLKELSLGEKEQLFLEALSVRPQTSAFCAQDWYSSKALCLVLPAVCGTPLVHFEIVQRSSGRRS
jgi:hypothetical protein